MSNKKRNRIIFSVAVAVVVFIACLSIFKIRSVEQYNNAENPAVQDAGQEDSGEGLGPRAELVIDCRSVLDNWDLLDEGLRDEKYVPQSGYILEPTKLLINDGDTAYDLLVNASKYFNIPIDVVGADESIFGSAYVKGINHLYEKSCGEMSGWMFMVNGEYPGEGCDSYVVQEGDVISFEYSCGTGDWNEEEAQ